LRFLIFHLNLEPIKIMKTQILLTLLLAAGITVYSAPADESSTPKSAVEASAPGADVLTVAVFDFDSKDEDVQGLGPKIATIVNAALSAEPSVITVERVDLEKILGEQELGLAGNVNADTAAKVGQLTGAKVLVTGRVFKVDKDLMIVAKVIGTETSRVYGELVKGGESASIADLATDLAKKIGNTIGEKGSTLVAKVETHEELVARIKKRLGDKKLPVVAVNITERHYGGPTIDPAAETELGKILQECGFTLTDDKSDAKPDIEITGEAFSEFGMRKGNFVSSKARVEIQVHQADGKLRLVDRQMSVAVDISEQIAGKTALQNAATELAVRILPKLVK
jgi:Curli production assembly/transport component CsgG